MTSVSFGINLTVAVLVHRKESFTSINYNAGFNLSFWSTVVIIYPFATLKDIAQQIFSVFFIGFEYVNSRWNTLMP